MTEFVTLNWTRNWPSQLLFWFILKTFITIFLLPGPETLTMLNKHWRMMGIMHKTAIYFLVQDSGRWWETEKPGVLQSMGSWEVRHDLVIEWQRRGQIYILYHSHVTYIPTNTFYITQMWHISKQDIPHTMLLFSFFPIPYLIFYLIFLNLQWRLYVNIFDEDISSKFPSLVRISLLKQVWVLVPSQWLSVFTHYGICNARLCWLPGAPTNTFCKGRECRS